MTSPKLKLVARDAPTIRTAIYCRYSSDEQTHSIERQTADLEKIAPRWDLKLNKQLYFSDAAQSATTLFDRPGLTRQLLDAAEKGLFDVVLVEHTDRLARKQADMFWLVEQFKSFKIKIFTPSGEVDPLRLTFESYQNEQFSVMLSGRVKSGQDNAVRDGRIPHGLGFGYVNGETKVKNPDQALVVVRIFRECATGKSPRNIAVDLTRDEIPSPSGGEWTFQTVNKILQNEIYIGVYVRNRIRRIRNYNTGKRDAHKTSADDLVTADHPDLRIVDQSLWDAAQAVRRDRANKTFGGRQIERATVARKLHPFAGLFHCADCGSKMIIAGSGRNGDRSIACSEAWWRSTTCKHRKSYSLARLTKHATERMHEHLTDPEFMKERASERAKQLASFEREANSSRETTQRELDRVDLRIKKLMRLIEDDDGDDVPQDLMDRNRELRAEHKGLTQRLAALDAQCSGATMHPNAQKALARDVDTLHKMLKENPDDPACRMALGNLIERVAVHPTGNGQPYDVSLFARHAAYVGELPLFPEYEAKNSAKNQRLARSNTGNAIVPSLPISQRPVLLGRWREDIGGKVKAA
jgi:site-specific DNA recombinase